MDDLKIIVKRLQESVESAITEHEADKKRLVEQEEELQNLRSEKLKSEEVISCLRTLNKSAASEKDVLKQHYEEELSNSKSKLSEVERNLKAEREKNKKITSERDVLKQHHQEEIDNLHARLLEAEESVQAEGVKFGIIEKLLEEKEEEFENWKRSVQIVDGQDTEQTEVKQIRHSSAKSKLRVALGLTKLESTGTTVFLGSKVYKTENGMILVKQSVSSGENGEQPFKVLMDGHEDSVIARFALEGEFESLKAIHATDTVPVPKPLAVIKHSSNPLVAMEYVTTSHITTPDYYALGVLLAKMHLHNESLKVQHEATSYVTRVFRTLKSEPPSYVSKFGFHVTTCYRGIPQDNTWNSNWVEFFIQQRMEKQFKPLFPINEYKEIWNLWSQLKIKIPSFFKDISITPALLHGNIVWGYIGRTEDGPVLYEPSSFYGHSELDLAGASYEGQFRGSSFSFGSAAYPSSIKCEGKFPSSFFTAYHKLLPKQPGFNKRMKLYHFYYRLCDWNSESTVDKQKITELMQELIGK